MKQSVKIKEYAENIGKEVPDWSTDGQILDVYKVPIDKLYYNDENGRIATWVSEFAENDEDFSLENMPFHEYNSKIHEFIKKSNSAESFKKTYDDVKTKGQIRPGVILADGRVVSGNRRFTVLRELYNDLSDDKYSYFKCFIIDKDLNDNFGRKQIKTIERLTQFGVDEKQDYDPIDRLVDIYNDLIGPKKIWNVEEYSKKLSLKKNVVEQMYYKAKIMADYLEYIGKPKKFYIARVNKLDGPLQELVRVYKSVTQNEWNNIRVIFYSYIQEGGDRTRDVRNLTKIFRSNTKGFYELLQKCVDDIERKEVSSILENHKQIGKDSIESISENITDKDIYVSGDNEDHIIDKVLSTDTKHEFFKVSSITVAENKRTEKVDKILKSLDNVLLYLEDTYSIMNNVEKENVKQKLSKLLPLFNNYLGE